MPASSLFDLLKPFLWLALAAFLTGFLLYLALSRGPGAARDPLDDARVSAPASEEWNLPKSI